MANARINIRHNLGTLVDMLKIRSIKKHKRYKKCSSKRYKDMKNIANNSLSNNKIKKRFEVC